MVVSKQRHGREQGFTMIELAVTVAILAVIAAIALPRFPDFVANYQLRRGVRGLVTQLNKMKVEAIRQNARTVMLINETNDTYTVFVDNNSENWALDTAEEGVVTDLGLLGLDISSNLTSSSTGFNGRGFQARATGGTITISTGNGNSQNVIISSVGSFRVN